MQVSENCINIIKECEGFRGKAYPDPGTGNLPISIGYGSTFYPNNSLIKMGDTCTEEQAVDFMMYEINHKVIPAMEKLITIELNQNQIDAVADFAYNVGIGNLKTSTLLKRINDGDFDEVSTEFAKWTKAAGKVLPGLVKRRKLESDLFSTPI